MPLLTTYSDLADFAPRINGCEESEPTLHRMLTYYYLQVFSQREAQELATEYIQALKVKLNMAA